MSTHSWDRLARVVVFVVVVVGGVAAGAEGSMRKMKPLLWRE